MPNLKKKYQVFISSTYTDLIEERQAAVEAILKAGHIPAGMELFKAGNEQLTTIKKWINESDIYLLILGKRYGSIESISGISYTEIEYKYALENKMPVFAIILDDCIAESKIASGFKHKDVYEITNIEKYKKFEAFVKTKMVCFAKSIAEIKLAIHENINQFEETYQLIGWIKGNNVINYSKLQELQELTKENILLKNKLDTMQKEIENKNEYNLADINSNLEIVVPYNFGREQRRQDLEISWSKLFSLIAPDIIAYQNEAHVHIQLSKYLFNLLGLSSSCSSSFIDEQLFFTIRTQLVAYGLINVQSLTTKNNTMALFWILTDKGKRLMMQLRTVKSKNN
jgi:hypothetical protein